MYLHLDDRQVVRLGEGFQVDAASGLVAELRVLLGPDAVIAQRASEPVPSY